MSFIWPAMLYSLFVIPLGIAFYLFLQQRRRQFAARYGSFGLLSGSTGLSLRRQIPPFFFLIGLTLLTLALARPQMVVSLPRQAGTIILAFDVSGSMAAKDVDPTRIEAAKAAAQDFVQHQPPTVQIGVVAFSDNSFMVQTPTNDREAILAAINRLTPQRGTSLAHGILASLNAIAASTEPQPDEIYSDLLLTPTPTPTPLPKGIHTPAVIVLLTDGENNEPPDPLEAAQTAADRGVRLYPVGLGSPTGTTLDINGFTVYTQLNEAMLQQIAQITEGTYYTAQSEEDLRSVYADVGSTLIFKPEKTEITSILAGLGLLVLLMGGGFSLWWFNRLP
jgi:Ca-activated chloride channel family protein